MGTVESRDVRKTWCLPTKSSPASEGDEPLSIQLEWGTWTDGSKSSMRNIALLSNSDRFVVFRGCHFFQEWIDLEIEIFIIFLFRTKCITNKCPLSQVIQVRTGWSELREKAKQQPQVSLHPKQHAPPRPVRGSQTTKPGGLCVLYYYIFLFFKSRACSFFFFFLYIWEFSAFNFFKKIISGGLRFWPHFIFFHCHFSDCFCCTQ